MHYLIVFIEVSGNYDVVIVVLVVVVMLEVVVAIGVELLTKCHPLKFRLEIFCISFFVYFFVRPLPSTATLYYRNDSFLTIIPRFVMCWNAGGRWQISM